MLNASQKEKHHWHKPAGQTGSYRALVYRAFDTTSWHRVTLSPIIQTLTNTSLLSFSVVSKGNNNFFSIVAYSLWYLQLCKPLSLVSNHKVRAKLNPNTVWFENSFCTDHPIWSYSNLQSPAQPLSKHAFAQKVHEGQKSPVFRKTAWVACDCRVHGDVPGSLWRREHFAEQNSARAHQPVQCIWYRKSHHASLLLMIRKFPPIFFFFNESSHNNSPMFIRAGQHGGFGCPVVLGTICALLHAAHEQSVLPFSSFKICKKNEGKAN